MYMVRGQWLPAGDAQMRGEGGFTLVAFLLRECLCKIILARNLLQQSEARYQVPICLLVPQGTVEKISTDHAGVQPRGRDCNPAVDPTTYV